MSSTCQHLGLRVRVPRDRGVHRRRVHRGRRRRPPDGASSAFTHVHVGSDRAPHRDRGLDAGQAARQDHILDAGDAITIPPDTPHSQLPHGERSGPRRASASRPARAATSSSSASAEIDYNRFGFPSHVGRALRHATGTAGHAARPSLKTQQRLAAARSTREYTFVDEWDVAAPTPRRLRHRSPTATPTPSGGSRSTSASSTRASTRSSTSRAACPTTCTRARRTIELRAPVPPPGRDRRRPARHRHLDPERERGRRHPRPLRLAVHADRRLLKLLTPILRPALRWNHNWAIARAIEGLEPYAQQRAKVVA